MRLVWVKTPSFNDFVAIMKTHNAVFRDEPNFRNYTAEIGFDRMKKEKDVAFVEVFDGDKMVGYAMCYNRYPGLYHIWQLGVLKEHRGKGVGSQIYEEIEKYSKKRKYRGVSLNTFNSHKENIILIIKRGYQIYDIDKTGEFKSCPKIMLKLEFE